MSRYIVSIKAESDAGPADLAGAIQKLGPGYRIVEGLGRRALRVEMTEANCVRASALIKFADFEPESYLSLL